MMTDPLYRVRVRLPPAYIESIRRVHGSGGQRALLADVRARVEAQGYTNTLVTMHDATTPEIVAVIARSSSPRAFSDGVATVETIEPVLEPLVERDSQRMRDGKAWLRRLDPGLSVDEAWTVGRALEVESNPRHLGGLASTCEPMFPIAASLLRAKALLTEPHVIHERGSKAAVAGEDVGRAFGLVGRCAAQHDLPMDLVHNEVKRAVCTYVDENGRPLGSALPDTPSEITNAAASVIEEPKRGIRFVNREALLGLCPPNGEEGFVSPSAVQLALAAGKPKVSRVGNVKEIDQVMRLLDHPHHVDRITLMRARSALEKAHRALERQRWVRWYSAASRQV